MASPVITGITFDKPVYTPGETITATVTFTTSNAYSPQQLTATVVDQLTSESASAVSGDNFATPFNVISGSGTTPDPVDATATDNRGSDTWTLVSNTASGPANDSTWSAVFTSVA